ncbi:MAG: Fe-S cluster assembly ATPase SufC [Clostridiales bacterium]|nr:Fe-S cluster assembly ATPase SufC [Clostridiales bacterium]
MSAENLLTLKNLTAGVGEAGIEILHNIDLRIGKGETHVIMGPNGAGKSTLGYTIMGNPLYEISSGNIIFDGEDITALTADKRAKKGIFLTFQSPVEVPGLTIRQFLRNALQEIKGERIKFSEFNRKLRSVMDTLSFAEEYADRDINVGFSGGERKKAEILQLLMLEPKLAILDETDSGLDVDAVKTVSAGISEYKKNKDGSLLIITHNAAILEALHVDKVHVVVKGKIVAEGDGSLVEEINRNGFERYTNEQ